ncbi:chromatin structure-remodeling complex subunit RSC1/2 [Sporothrix schenckii 1099-18]|uniref:Chromatin structure-remodeling complex subunit RSC1/2 n=1 Tax=Sporothrix schenckii 1099-18 TaxID=1397361 RepID=A0A0F2LRG1_SPOSC|nr:chromatin structure-remodeling complex subunit RSC1/2 [Sporothrix schenckii 1099-18]KJR80092.1 chromatin structure-remodeling complex subunit RSC1/2 [Sporothrix schenckii 1099-18]
MAGDGVAEKQLGGADASSEVHESIEAKATKPRPSAMEEDADADADGDEDADGEADPDLDADGDDDIEMTDAAMEVTPGASDDAKAAQAAAFRAKRDLLHLIETTAHYLSTYEEDGIEVASGFQRIPNKRVIPDYFDIIKEPTAFSTIRGRVQKRVYTDFTQFVRDVALICHNAQVYNRPSAPIFQYAVKLREIFKAKLQQLVQDGSIQPKEAELPYLGEIPDFSPSPPADDDDGEQDEDEDEDEEESEDDDDDDDDVDSETGRRRRKGGSAAARHKLVKQNGGAMSSRMYTATEGRINAVIAGLQKAEDEDGDPLLDPFETLPDKELLPDYYEEIKNPIAIDIIKRKSRRKIYLTVDDAAGDFELMFNNAKLYNQDGSEIFVAAVKLQALMRRLVAQERQKPDDVFRDQHGRLAVPGVQHLGQVWRIGDWVLLRNANDPSKPIVAQIFRMWFDRDGRAWINACWYYRPEQTVHRFDRHFYENEVIKTEQYRDHPFEDVLDRTFVMYLEQYARGRPRGYPPNKTLYVCEYRYSEDTFRFTKITKWETCVPEEVRGLDILMEPYPAPRRFPKFPSPIKHLLHANASETDALPKPTWGNPNAPPMIGSVHRRPRLPNLVSVYTFPLSFAPFAVVITKPLRARVYFDEPKFTWLRFMALEGCMDCLRFLFFLCQPRGCPACLGVKN